MEHERLRGLVESLIFVSDDPLSLKDISSLLENIEETEIQAVMDELTDEYARETKGLAIRKVAGGYQMYTKQIYHPWIQKLFDEKRARKLSESAMETLAIISYRQPITIPEINQIRGVQSQAVVKTLLVKKLIVVRGRKKVIGRPRTYGTSEEFLIKFGLNHLKDLPPVEEFAELLENTGEGKDGGARVSDRAGATEQAGTHDPISEKDSDDANADSEDHLDDGDHLTPESGTTAD
jgi:segregation and condensation protein B